MPVWIPLKRAHPLYWGLDDDDNVIWENFLLLVASSESS